MLRSEDLHSEQTSFDQWLPDITVLDPAILMALLESMTRADTRTRRQSASKTARQEVLKPYSYSKTTDLVTLSLSKLEQVLPGSVHPFLLASIRKSHSKNDEVVTQLATIGTFAHKIDNLLSLIAKYATGSEMTPEIELQLRRSISVNNKAQKKELELLLKMFELLGLKLGSDYHGNLQVLYEVLRKYLSERQVPLFPQLLQAGRVGVDSIHDWTRLPDQDGPPSVERAALGLVGAWTTQVVDKNVGVHDSLHLSPDHKNMIQNLAVQLVIEVQGLVFKIFMELDNISWQTRDGALIRLEIDDYKSTLPRLTSETLFSNSRAAIQAIQIGILMGLGCVMFQEPNKLLDHAQRSDFSDTIKLPPASFYWNNVINTRKATRNAGVVVNYRAVNNQGKFALLKCADLPDDFIEVLDCWFREFLLPYLLTLSPKQMKELGIRFSVKDQPME